MHHKADRIFWFGSIGWLAALVGVDVVSGGTQRPFLVALLIAGGAALWVLTSLGARSER